VSGRGDRSEPRPSDERPPLKITDRRRFAEQVAGDEGAPAAAPADEPDATEETAGEQGADAREDIAAARTEAQEYLDHLRRLQAEFDNYRKRTAKEQAQTIELAAMPVIRRLLEVIDDFELALMAAEQQPDFERFRKGVELVFAKFADTLKSEGLERIEAEGRPFDPELHEALMQTGEGEGEPVVADVLRPGYTLKGRVLRPAGVRVERS
jgi:molecular chaperone GrpE